MSRTLSSKLNNLLRECVNDYLISEDLQKQFIEITEQVHQLELKHKEASNVVGKYEYKVFSSHQDYINKNLQYQEENGWQVCGDAHVKYHDRPTSAAFIYIPMKKLIQTAKIKPEGAKSYIPVDNGCNPLRNLIKRMLCKLLTAN